MSPALPPTEALGAEAPRTEALTGDAPQWLDPLQFPLRGSRLIEASAGTGKTWTIAALYLRLVLGHGGVAAYPRALTPPEILVVTFTEAATRELRDRIRARLAEAAAAFLDPAPDATAGDDFLHALRNAVPPAQWPAQARTLQLAAEAMDEAAVSTIHSWCLRMLQEHAFDSGSLFTQQLEADQRLLQAEAVRDYWRCFFTPLPLADAQAVQAIWATPDALAKDLRRLQGPQAALPPGAAPQAALARVRAALDEIKRPWRGDQGWAAALDQRLADAVAAKQLRLDRRADWMRRLREWAETDLVAIPWTDAARERMCAERLVDTRSKGGPLVDALLSHPALIALGRLPAQLAALPTARSDILCHAVAWVAERLAQEQARRALMGFDELLTRLDAALQGPNGAALAQRIRAQFPVAMIDEFQDTDPVQYRIFDAVYRVARNDAQTALVLIGDPKQAIYAFRGADIHTYLAARRHTGDRHATLGTNFRSTHAMVDAVNALFARAEQAPRSPGAFRFRGAQGNPVPFYPVAARGRAAAWHDAGTAAPALTFWTVPAEGKLTQGDARDRVAEACASEIVRLLNGAQAGHTGFAGETGHVQPLQPLQPRDVAVLVHSGTEAAAVRQALARRGVRSVYLSDKESVYQSAAAADLQRWLQACAQPEDDRLLRAALATATLGLDWAALDALNQDELQWERRVLQFREFRQMWRRQGVLPMLRHLLHDFAVPARLVAAGDERTLTDLLHLAELLQAASAAIEGEYGLIRFLAEQRADSDASNDVLRLRLESDADLVQVVTVHKSKGLEYPLVFLPFGTAFKEADRKKPPLVWHDAQGRRQVALQPDAEAERRADAERLGEDLRKLYVALTRARYATWVGAAPLADVQRSALGCLLAAAAGSDADTPMDAAALDSALHALAAACSAIAVRPLPEATAQAVRPPARATALAPEPPLPAPRTPWWVASYSALRVEEGATSGAGLLAPAGPSTGAENSFLDSREDDSAAPLADGARPGAGSLHLFPAGARAGTFLHGLLEWAARQGFAQVLAQPQRLRQQIVQQCEREGWGVWVDTLQAWLIDWLQRPLALQALVDGIAPVAPAGLTALQPELEFWFAADQVDTRALDALVSRHVLPGQVRPALSAQQLNGMLKGFIDLVFEHQGRYFVADYKSNRLGTGDADYTPQAMAATVLAQRYELQYVLYLLALHRLLRARLPGYDYERHIGGAVYLFLRGHAAPSQGLHLQRPSAELMHALDRLFAGEPLAGLEANR